MSSEGSCSTRRAPNSKFIFESTFYPEIEAGDRIPTEPFLAACHVVVDFLSMLGRIFVPVKADINGHIDKVRKLVTSDPKKFAFLDAIIDPEVPIENKDKKRKQDAILSLTWLKRTCEFILYFLKNFTDPKNQDVEDLRPMFREAYELKLKVHHNVIAQKLFQVCVHAAPSRSSMVAVLTGKGDRSEQQVYNIMITFLQGMSKNVDCLIRTFNKYELQQ